MKRLQRDELNTRIHEFLRRKLQEFPELARDGARPAGKGGTLRQPKLRTYHPRMYWGARPL